MPWIAFTMTWSTTDRSNCSTWRPPSLRAIWEHLNLVLKPLLRHLAAWPGHATVHKPVAKKHICLQRSCVQNTRTKKLTHEVHSFVWPSDPRLQVSLTPTGSDRDIGLGNTTPSDSDESLRSGSVPRQHSGWQLRPLNQLLGRRRQPDGQSPPSRHHAGWAKFAAIAGIRVITTRISVPRSLSKSMARRFMVTLTGATTVDDSESWDRDSGQLVKNLQKMVELRW